MLGMGSYLMLRLSLAILILVLRMSLPFGNRLSRRQGSLCFLALIGETLSAFQALTGRGIRS